MNKANTTNIFKSYQDELIKLYVLVGSEENQMFSGEYLEGKLRDMVQGRPLILHPALTHSYELVKNKFEEPSV